MFFLVTVFQLPYGLVNSVSVGSKGFYLADRQFDFFVLQAGWHTGIVLRTANVSPADWFDVVNYLPHKYIDIGWGDERFYQAEGNPPLLAVRAAIMPTSSVIHIVPFSVDPHNLYTGEVFLKRIEATPEQFKALCRIISDRFQRDSNGNPIESRINENSRNFFKSKGKYHILNTCNTWVVQCLKDAGFDVNPAGVITQRHLINALGKLPGGDWVEKKGD
jgi:uncharacterized protein (TIGR02117 family)